MLPGSKVAGYRVTAIVKEEKSTRWNEINAQSLEGAQAGYTLSKKSLDPVGELCVKKVNLSQTNSFPIYGLLERS